MLDQGIKNNILTLFDYLGIPQESVEIVEAPEGIKINLNVIEADAGIFIGHYAETLDGIQRIVSNFVNKDQPEHIPVTVDIAGYRDRRYNKLVSLSERLKEEVRATGAPHPFPPGLSATERRQIHLLFGDDEEFTTYSEGLGEARRLYLAFKAN